MKFTKMQGCGNDYVYVNCFSETVNEPAKLAKRVSDRNFGIGSDGLILICPSDKADCRMDMYNSDGSKAEMCGNGIRCVGKYAYDYGIVKKDVITVETLAGIKTLKLNIENGRVKTVRVNMGKPELKPERIPVAATGDNFINRAVEVDGSVYNVTCVSVGNPHAIVYVDNTDAVDIEHLGPLFENHVLFPKRINTEFVQVLDRSTLKMRVWERGAGETKACGTGATATLIASVLNNKSDRKAKIILLGGELEIEWPGDDDCVYMTGPAETVFDGELYI